MYESAPVKISHACVQPSSKRKLWMRGRTTPMILIVSNPQRKERRSQLCMPLIYVSAVCLGKVDVKWFSQFFCSPISWNLLLSCLFSVLCNIPREGSSGKQGQLEITPVARAIARHMSVDLSPEGFAARNRTGIAIIVYGGPLTGDGITQME